MSDDTYDHIVLISSNEIFEKKFSNSQPDFKTFLQTVFNYQDSPSLRKPVGNGNKVKIEFSGWNLDLDFSAAALKNFFESDLSLFLSSRPVLSVHIRECNFASLNIDEVFVSNWSLESFLLESLKFSCSTSFRASSGVVGNLKIGQKSTLLNLELTEVQIKDFKAEKVQFSNRLSFIKTSFGLKGGRSDFSFLETKFFGELLFEDCIFWRAPAFSKDSFSFQTLFYGCKCKDTSSPDSVERWSTLKHLLQEMNFDSQSQEFHAAEVDSKRRRMKLFSRNFWEKLSSYFLYITSNYGRTLLLCPMWLIGLWVAFGYLYDAVNLAKCNDSALADSALWLSAVCACDGPTRKAFVFSALQSLGPLGIIYSDTAFGPATIAHKMIAFAHFLLASLIWFIWIFQTRAKFKL